MLKWKKLDVKDLKKIRGGEPLPEMIVVLSATPVGNGLGEVISNGNPDILKVATGMYNGVDGLINAAFHQIT